MSAFVPQVGTNLRNPSSNSSSFHSQRAPISPSPKKNSSTTSTASASRRRRLLRSSSATACATNTPQPNSSPFSKPDPSSDSPASPSINNNNNKLDNMVKSTSSIQSDSPISKKSSTRMQDSSPSKDDLSTINSPIIANPNSKTHPPSYPSRMVAFIVFELAMHVALAAVAVAASLAARRRPWVFVASALSVPSVVASVSRIRNIGANHRKALKLSSKTARIHSNPSTEPDPATVFALRAAVSDDISSMRSAINRSEGAAAMRDRTLTQAMASLDTSVRSLRSTIDAGSGQHSLPALAELEAARGAVREAESARDRERSRADAAEAARAESRRLAEAATAEVDASARRELALRSQAATDAARLVRLEQLARRLDSAERVVDDLRDEIVRSAREAERLRLAAEEAEIKADRVESMANVLRERLAAAESAGQLRSSKRLGLGTDDDDLESEDLSINRFMRNSSRLQDRGWDKRRVRSNREPGQPSLDDYGPGASSDSARVSWPVNPLGTNVTPRSTPQTQIMQGLPSDGGFGSGTNNTPILGQSRAQQGPTQDTTVNEDPSLPGEKTFSFSRDEFDGSNTGALPTSGNDTLHANRDLSKQTSNSVTERPSQDEVQKCDSDGTDAGFETPTDSASKQEIPSFQDSSDFHEPNTTVDLPNAFPGDVSNSDGTSPHPTSNDQLYSASTKADPVLEQNDASKDTNAVDSKNSGVGVSAGPQKLVVHYGAPSQDSSIADSGPYERIEVLDDSVFDSSPAAEQNEANGLNQDGTLKQSLGSFMESRSDESKVDLENALSGESTREMQSPGTQASESGGKDSEVFSNDGGIDSRSLEIAAEPEVAGMYDDASETESHEEVDRPHPSIAAAKLSLQNLLKTKSGTLDESDDGSLGIGEAAEEETIIESGSGNEKSGSTEDEKDGSLVTPDDNVSEVSASDPTRNKSSDIEKAKENVSEEDSPSGMKASELAKKAKELVKKGRRRGTTVAESDALFDEASSKLEQALLITDDKAQVEGELGSCLLAWAKANVGDSQMSSRLSKALDHLNKSLDRRPNDETTLFNCGLCLCLLGSTSEKNAARNYYEKACELYDRVLKGNPNSRVGAFNCGLAYVSMGRLALMENENKQEIMGYFQSAVNRFEKSLKLKPEDNKATAYLQDCQRQIEELKKRV